MPKATFHPMNPQDKYKPIKYLQGSINPNTTIVMTWIPLTPQVQYQPLTKLPVMTHTTDRIPSTTPGAEPPRDAKDSGSARSHSTHLETSSSNRP